MRAAKIANRVQIPHFRKVRKFSSLGIASWSLFEILAIFAANTSRATSSAELFFRSAN